MKAYKSIRSIFDNHHEYIEASRGNDGRAFQSKEHNYIFKKHPSLSTFIMWKGIGCILYEGVTSVAWLMTTSLHLSVTLRVLLVPLNYSGLCYIRDVRQRCSSRPNSLTKTHCISCTVIFSPAALTKNTAFREGDDRGGKMLEIWRVSYSSHRWHGSAAKVVHKLYKLLSAGGHRMSSARSAINGRQGSSGVCEWVSGVWHASRKMGGEVMQLRKTGLMTHACCNTDCGYEPMWISWTNKPQ